MARIINAHHAATWRGSMMKCQFLAETTSTRQTSPPIRRNKNRALSTTRRGDERSRPCRENRADHPPARLR